MPRIRVVNVYAVSKRAKRAITSRLHYWDPRTIISIQRDPDVPRAVILHVNSGGNAAACRSAFHLAGYRVEPTGYDPYAPGNYGVQLRILPGVS